VSEFLEVVAICVVQFARFESQTSYCVLS